MSRQHRLVGARAVGDRRTLGESERSEGVQTIEGRPAFIRSGTAVPVPEWQSFGGGALPYVEQGVRYHDATAGFYVTPRMAGDEVMLEISQQVVRPGAGSPPTFAVQQAASTLRVRITVRMLRWLDLTI